MKKFINNFISEIIYIFQSTDYNWRHYLLILVVGIVFIWMPQNNPTDWNLNTNGFWSDFPHAYSNNRNFVYPPWGLILLYPYFIIQSFGARILSVVAIGWLYQRRKQPFKFFLFTVLSPYFLVTMTKSSMDILVIVFPILLWETFLGKRFEVIARGIAVSLLLLKPQCTIFITLYLLWKDRKDWKTTLKSLVIPAILMVPISFIGSPPLISQWVKNIFSPSDQNQYFWSMNNISLTANFGIWIAHGMIGLTVLLIFGLHKSTIFSWSADQTTSAILFTSMYLMPYTSQQSISSGLAFIPSNRSFYLQWIGVALGFVTFGFNNNIPLWTLFIVILSMLFNSFSHHSERTNPKYAQISGTTPSLQ